MHFGDRLKALRTQRHMTQQQLAQRLFVSRTAVSKWETGRGTPSIDSLQSVAKLFDVTLDALLSEEELAAIEQGGRGRPLGLTGPIAAAMDIMAFLGFVLPMYGLHTAGAVLSVPLLRLESGGMRTAYIVLLAVLCLCGLAEAALLKWGSARAQRRAVCIGLAVNIFLILLFIASGQLYAATLYFLFLLLKGAAYLRDTRPKRP